MTLWQKIKERLTSTKFLTMIATIIGLVVSALEGLQSWSWALAEIAGVVFAWIQGQARVDASNNTNGS